MSEWKDIASAPFGQEIMAWIETEDGSGWCIVGDMIDDDPHVFERYDGRYYPCENGGWPTHWMALPAPPEK